jgi:cobalt-zinc-cadmium efflux system membrane fusion protein
MTPLAVRTTPLLLLLAALVGLPACGSSPAPEPAPTTDTTAPAVDVQMTPDQIARGGIVVATLEEETWAETFEAPAVLQLDQRHTVRVGAPLDARVDEVQADVGDTVRRGTVLVELHSHVTHDAVAELRKAVSATARLESDLAYATSSLARAQRLLTDGAASPQDVERATTAVAALRREIEMARADQARARAELGYYGVDVAAIDKMGPEGHHDDHVPVRAPLAGTVLERLVTPGTTVTSGQPMFVVSDLSTLWVVGEVEERWAPMLQSGRDATVRVTAFPDETFSARVTYIGDVVAADTRRITVRAELPNGDRRLKPEMYARLVLSGESRTAVTVPADAVQRVDGKDVVFVETAPGRFAPVAVTTAAGDVRDGRVALLDGVAAGSRVVTQGAFLVRSEFQKAMLTEEE